MMFGVACRNCAGYAVVVLLTLFESLKHST